MVSRRQPRKLFIAFYRDFAFQRPLRPSKGLKMFTYVYCKTSKKSGPLPLAHVGSLFFENVFNPFLTAPWRLKSVKAPAGKHRSQLSETEIANVHARRRGLRACSVFTCEHAKIVHVIWSLYCCNTWCLLFGRGTLFRRVCIHVNVPRHDTLGSKKRRVITMASLAWPQVACI